MSATAGFPLFLALTLLFLGLVVITGLKARRKFHITFVLCAITSLGVTIHYALALGKLYDLASAGIITPIHLTLAKITTALYLLPITTGLRTIFAPKTRRLHRKLAFLVLSMTVVTAITGTAMILMSKRVG